MTTKALPVSPAASLGGEVSASESALMMVGHISVAYGIKGWVKIHALTEPLSNIFGYRPWQLKTRDGFRPVKVLEWRAQGKGIVAQLDIAPDRNAADALKNLEIWVPKAALPTLDAGDYYWSDLIGLTVQTEAGQSMGVVDGLMETGSNDVLIVQGNANSMDTRERLIPWLLGSVVKKVDLGARVITVDWDPAF